MMCGGTLIMKMNVMTMKVEDLKGNIVKNIKNKNKHLFNVFFTELQFFCCCGNAISCQCFPNKLDMIVIPALCLF